MAIITPGLISALNTDFRREFQNGLAQAQPMGDRIATRVPSTSSKNTYGWLGQFPRLREWVGDRVFKDMQAHGYEITNKKYEASVRVERTVIEDDATGTYLPAVQEMGYGARMDPDGDIFATLGAGLAANGYDGQHFFDTDHPVAANVDGTGAVTTASNLDAGGAGPFWYLLCTKRPLRPLIFQERQAPRFVMKANPQDSDMVFVSDVYVWGSDCRHSVGFGLWQFAYASNQEFNSANLLAAYQAMMSVTADGGRPLGVVPDLVVGGPTLLGKFKQTLDNEYDSAGASNTTRGLVDHMVSPWLA
jgi:phage major head subunit gpT-like protein